MPKLQMPQPGDIVRCRFPFEEDHNLFKFRYALVLFVAEPLFGNKQGVVVAYGTSQKLDRIYPDEFLLDQQNPVFAVSGLKKSTKFNLSRTEIMEVRPRNFLFGPDGRVSVGVLHPSLIEKVRPAWKKRTPVSGLDAAMSLVDESLEEHDKPARPRMR